MTGPASMILRRGIVDALNDIKELDRIGILTEGYANNVFTAVRESIAICKEQGQLTDALSRELEKVEELVRGKRAAENPGPPAA